jgi:hypothetical protein
MPNTSKKYKEWTPAYVIETYKKNKIILLWTQ